MPKPRTSLFTPVLLVGCFIMLISLANIGGTLFAGYPGKRYPKKYLLVGIYTGRTIIADLFILNPITPTSVILFSAAMGSLYGIVFFSHQLGNFLGVWLGGKFFDHMAPTLQYGGLVSP